MVFTRWNLPTVKTHPVEKKVRTVYYADSGGKHLAKTELGSYLSNAIGRAVERVLGEHHGPTPFVQVVDEVNGELIAELRLVDDFHLNITITPTLPPAKRKHQRKR